MFRRPPLSHCQWQGEDVFFGGVINRNNELGVLTPKKISYLAKILLTLAKDYSTIKRFKKSNLIAIIIDRF
jgi:hypothetical protein